MRTTFVLWACSIATIAACGPKEADGPPVVECRDIDASAFDDNSGWDSASYCDVPTQLGCYPWHESTADTCGPFTTMRTSATSDASTAACQTLVSSLNCASYRADSGTDELSFNIASEDRFTMRVTGTFKGRAVDTTFYFNPCHQACLAAVTLETLDDDQQKICDIPRQGKPACLFPETAHSLTFVRADGGSIVVRSGGDEIAFARITDAQ